MVSGIILPLIRRLHRQRKHQAMLASSCIIRRSRSLFKTWAGCPSTTRLWLPSFHPISMAWYLMAMASTLVTGQTYTFYHTELQASYDIHRVGGSWKNWATNRHIKTYK